MEEREQKRGGVGCAIMLVMVLLLLPVLYFLSIGPVAWWLDNESTWWAEIFYYPIGWLAEHSKPFHDVLGWYVKFWVS